MGADLHRPVPEPGQHGRVRKWECLPRLNSRITRTEWTVGRAVDAGEAVPAGLIVNGVPEDSYVTSVEVGETEL